MTGMTLDMFEVNQVKVSRCLFQPIPEVAVPISRPVLVHESQHDVLRIAYHQGDSGILKPTVNLPGDKFKCADGSHKLHTTDGRIKLRAATDKLSPGHNDFPGVAPGPILHRSRPVSIDEI